ncbi:Holliday junction ATP-dependent DNA helicase RuvA [Microbacterium sp. HM58-2]|nr:Holliday junction ATP-dependent DNA helicase RuvA [Microbacterium sp. HM58-2]
MVAQLQLESRMRPAAESRAYLKVACELSRLWPLYLEAIVTADISEAEALSAQGQKVLDCSTSELTRLGTLEEAIGALVNARGDEDILTRVFAALAVLYPETPFSELAKIGERRAMDLVARPVALGSSIDFLTVEMIARAYLDPQQFSLKVSELGLLLAGDARVRAVAKMPGALADLGIARRDLFEALTQFEKIASTESDTSVLLRRLSKTVGELYEASLPFLVWCRLILAPSISESTYDRMVLKDATEHIAWLVRQLPLTFSDAPAYLRHSAHHGRAIDIGLAGETVEINLRSFRESFSAAEYIDKAYALLESVLAVCWVISNALEVEGLTAELPPGAAQYIGLSHEALVGLWLREYKGVRVVQSQRDGDGWRLELGLAAQETFITALSLATLSGTDCDWVSVCVEGETEPPAELSVDDYSRYAERATLGGAESALALLTLRHQVTVGARCLVGESDVEFVIVCLGLAILSGDLSQVPLLREARRLAANHRYAGLVSLANSVLKTIRTGQDSDIRAELSKRTKSFKAAEVPVVSAVRVRLRGVSQRPRRICD